MKNTLSIDLFDPNRSQYQALNYFTRGLKKGLEKAGAHCKLVQIDDAHDVVSHLKNPPDLTVAFNGLLPNEEGKFLSDITGVPHFAYIVDPPFRFPQMLNAKKTFLAYFDSSYSDLSSSYNKHSYFFPHAIDSSRKYDSQKEKDYDIVFPMTFTDPQVFKKEWEPYPEPLKRAMDQAIHALFFDPSQSLIEALTAYLPRDLEESTRFHLLSLFESYVKASGQLRLLEALDGMPIHLFGNWKNIIDHLPLKHKDRLTLHNGIDYEDMISVYERSKIVLNATPKVRFGTHERVLEALSSGALPLTDENPFTLKNFPTVPTYSFKDPSQIKDQIAHLLKDENERNQRIETGKQEVFANFTWENRAGSILELVL